MAKAKRTGTDEIIAESFKKQARKHPIDKITIGQIAEGAGVIRSTFYNHFEDKYDLLKWCIFRDVITPAYPLIDMGMYEEAFLFIFTCLEKDKTFYKAAARLTHPVSFIDICSSCITEILMSVLGKTVVRSSWLTPENVTRYYAISLSIMIESWLNGEVEISAKEVGEAYKFIMTKSIKEVFDSFIEEKEFLA